MRPTLIVTAIVFLTTAHVQADEVPDICTAAFHQGIYDSSSTLTNEERFNLFQQRILSLKSDNFQSFESSAGNLGVNLPLAEGLLGLTAADQQNASLFHQHFEEFRSSTYSDSRYRQYVETHSSQISAVLLSSWDKCVDRFYTSWLEQKGASVKVLPQGDFREFTAIIDVKPAMLNHVHILSIEPTGLVDCVTGPSTKVFFQRRHSAPQRSGAASPFP